MQINSMIVEESLYVASYSDFASYGDIARLARRKIYRFVIPICYATNRVAKEIHNYIFNINRKILLQNILY